MSFRFPQIKLGLFLKIGLSFLLASLLPISILAFYSINQTSKTTQAGALETNRLISKQASQQFDIFLSNVEKTVEAVVENIELQNNDFTKVNQVLNFYRQQYTVLNVPVFESFVLLDGKGNLVTVSPFESSFIGNDYSHQDYYLRVIKNKETYFSPQVTVSSITGKPTIHVGVPALVSGSVNSVLVAEVSLEGVSRFNNQTKVGKSGFSFIIDENGTVVAHPNEDFTLQQQNVSNIYSGLNRASFASQTAISWPPKNPTILFSPTKLEKTSWIAVFKQDYSEIFRIPQEIRDQLVFLFVASFIIIVLFTFGLTRQIVRPLNKLKDAMGAIISQEEFNSRVKITTRDEIGDLANEFNFMSESLQKRTQEIQEARHVAEGQKNQINSILQTMVDCVLALDFQGRVFKVNPAALAMLGCKEEDIIEKNLDEILVLSEKTEKITVKDLLPKQEVSQASIVMQRKGVRVETKKGGEAVYVNLTSSAISEGRELGLGAIITLSDVTREKELEEMKLDFVSMAAHELRTPLTSVRGYLSVLMDELRKKITPEQLSFLDKAFISSTQLAALVENLLSVARIERGALQIQTQPTDWEEIVEETYNNFLPQAKERQVELKLVKPTKKLPLVNVDKFRIGEVVSNLVGNALNYTPSGGRVELSTEITPTEVVTHVKDTGQGIPAAAIPKLFTKFFRVSGVLEQGSKGTGLGLYISKAVVDMHKGRIWVESEVGKGSDFSFSVPRSAEKKIKTVTPGRKMFMRKRKS